MQEEIENRTVTLIISAVKLTARELKAVILKYLDISCLFHSFQQTVLTECHSLTLLCQLRTSV